MTAPARPFAPAHDAPGFLAAYTPPQDILRQFEEACGFHVVEPGAVKWLRSEDWYRDTVVSLDGRASKLTARLILMVAMHPGTGTMRRLLSELWFRDIIPAVIEPHARLAAFLHTYGFSPRRATLGAQGWQEWRPFWPDELESGKVNATAWHNFSGL